MFSVGQLWHPLLKIGKTSKKRREKNPNHIAIECTAIKNVPICQNNKSLKQNWSNTERFLLSAETVGKVFFSPKSCF